MFSLIKGAFRYGAIALLAAGVIGGGAVLVAGPQRAKAVMEKVHCRAVAKYVR